MGEGNDRGRDSWMASLTQQTWIWEMVKMGDGEGQESLVCYCPWGHKELHMNKWLNNNPFYRILYIDLPPLPFLEQFLKDIRGAFSWATVLICSK